MIPTLLSVDNFLSIHKICLKCQSVLGVDDGENSFGPFHDMAGLNSEGSGVVDIQIGSFGPFQEMPALRS